MAIYMVAVPHIARACGPGVEDDVDRGTIIDVIKAMCMEFAPELRAGGVEASAYPLFSDTYIPEPFVAPVTSPQNIRTSRPHLVK